MTVTREELDDLINQAELVRLESEEACKGALVLGDPHERELADPIRLTDRLLTRNQKINIAEGSFLYHVGRETARRVVKDGFMLRRFGKLIRRYARYAPVDFQEALEDEVFLSLQNSTGAKYSKIFEDWADKIRQSRQEADSYGIPVPSPFEFLDPLTGLVEIPPPGVLPMTEVAKIKVFNRRKMKDGQ